MHSRGLGDLPDSWGMLLIWINGSCINDLNCTSLLLLIRRCGSSWQRRTLCRRRLSARTRCVPGPAHGSHPGCPQELPGWWQARSLGRCSLCTLPCWIFLGRLFSRNSLKICNYRTRAEWETCRLPVPSGRASPCELAAFVGSSSSCSVLEGKEWSSCSRRGCRSAGAAIGETQPPRSRAVSVPALPLISPIALEMLPSR